MRPRRRSRRSNARARRSSRPGSARIRTVDAENDTIRPFDRENFALWLETLSARIAQANTGGLEHSAKALRLLGGS